MNLGETNASLRRIFLTIFFDDGVTLSTDAATSPPVGTIKISQNGAVFANAAGTLTHIGSGAYYYEATLTEASTQGFLVVKYERAGYKTEIDWDAVGSIFSVGEATASNRRLPVTIYDSSGSLATGATVAVASELQVSINGGSYTNSTGSLTELSSGAYYYEGSTSDVTTPGVLLVKYEKSGFTTMLSTISVSTTSVSTTVSLIALAPDDGSELNIDPEIARFTPVVATLQCASGEVPYVFATIGSLSWTVYDGTQARTMPFFADHTTVTALGSDQYEISILPNGGWWRSAIDIHFVSGVEGVLS